MSQTSGPGSGRGQSSPNMSIGLAPGMPGYHGYQLPPMYAFPPQAMPGSGVMPMVAPPDAYACHGMSNDKSVGTHNCTVHPKGMPRAFDVPFPERRLPVCDRCKKNFKSRDLCRKRDGHKALPWQTTYIAVTITDSALERGEDGSLTYADIPVVAELQETPLMCLGPADGSMKMEPICKVCREKNYTRDYCRNTCKHTTPPWSTTYIKLVADRTPKDDHKFKYPKKRKKNQEENADGRPKLDRDSPHSDGDTSDDLSEIHMSKTFLAAISSKKMTVRWCERIQYPLVLDQEEATDAALPPTTASVMPPYMNAPSNPNMQHQNNQLWDAFRAGAMWAQSQAGQVPGYGYGSMPNPGVGSPMAFFSPSPAGGGYASASNAPPPNRRPKADENYGEGENGGEGSCGIGGSNEGEGI